MNALDKRVIAHAKSGTPPRFIAGLENVAQSKIYAILKAARARGEEVPLFRNTGGVTNTVNVSRGHVERPTQLVIGLRLMGLLESAASRKGVSPQQLGRDIIEAKLLDTEACLQVTEARHG